MDANDHDIHNEACGCMPMPENQLALADNLQPNPINHLTEAQFRQLRGRYFTVRHFTVPECGHKLDMINEPTFRNCEYCWWAFFSSHGELVQVTDKAFQEQGPAFLDKMRGVQYRKMFTRFMATMARFKAESDALKGAQESNGEGSTGD